MNEASAAQLDDRMSWREICERFPDEWIVIVDADWVDEHNFDFSTARVFAHRKARREATHDMGTACATFHNVGCFFTGRIRGPVPRFGVS